MLILLALASPCFHAPSLRQPVRAPLSRVAHSQRAAVASNISGEEVLTAGAGLVGLATLAAAAYLVNMKLAWDRITALRRDRLAGPTKSRSVAPSSPGYVQPRELWLAEELAVHDGSASEDSPILLAADGLIYNVSPARHLYGPGREYAVMAGRDASAFLATNSVDEAEARSAAARGLSLAERGSLAAWAFSLKSKYDVVGRLATSEEAAARVAARAKADAYAAAMESMSDRLLQEASGDGARDAGTVL